MLRIRGEAVGWVSRRTCWEEAKYSPDVTTDKCKKHRSAIKAMAGRSGVVGRGATVPAWRLWLCSWHSSKALVEWLEKAGLLRIVEPVWLGFKYIVASRTARDVDDRAHVLYQVRRHAVARHQTQTQYVVSVSRRHTALTHGFPRLHFATRSCSRPRFRRLSA